MPLTAEYALLLDAIVPLAQPRVDYQGWDEPGWGRTLQIADWHRLSPVLFCHLKPRHDAPAAVQSALERVYLANAARNMFMASSLRRVVDALSGAGIPALLLKGAALAETAYPDPAQREMLDLDVLVPADRVDAASATLAELGYRAAPRDGESPSTTMAIHLGPDDHHAPALIGDERLLAVELHRHILIAGEGRRFDIDEVWQRGRPSGRGVHLLPAPEDLLLHVCLHFTRNRLGGSYRRRHTGGALGQICDIARIVEHQSVDWVGLAEMTRRYRLETRIFLGLFAARELGVAIPGSLLAELQPPGFDPALGRRLIALRVLRSGDQLPVRTLRWMFAPSREVLSHGWNADPTATMSLARAYMRRARANVPLARAALRRPWLLVQDQRLGDQIQALEERT
ncbi:MAG: nucleotidyltransferase family protein [Solirubrobacterales bacterium]|nr:nucleotidyltransferase family protein [Solirubrobacterales bacterium]